MCLCFQFPRSLKGIINFRFPKPAEKGATIFAHKCFHRCYRVAKRKKEEKRSSAFPTRLKEKYYYKGKLSHVEKENEPSPMAFSLHCTKGYLLLARGDNGNSGGQTFFSPRWKLLKFLIGYRRNTVYA